MNTVLQDPGLSEDSGFLFQRMLSGIRYEGVALAPVTSVFHVLGSRYWFLDLLLSLPSSMVFSHPFLTFTYTHTHTHFVEGQAYDSTGKNTYCTSLTT